MKTKKQIILDLSFLLIVSSFLFLSNLNTTRAEPSYEPGTLLKSNTSSAVYYIGKDNEKYVFTDERTYYSWYDNFDNVIETDVQELDKHEDGGAITIRPGTKLITHVDTAKVYAVEPNGVLRHIPDEQTASALYGNNWKSLVVDIPTILFTTTYTKGDDLSNTLPTGTIVKQKGTNGYYYIKNGKKRPFISGDAFEVNKLKFSNAIEADISNYEYGEFVREEESDLLGFAKINVIKTILKVDPIDLSNIQTEKLSFVNNYSLDALNVNIKVPSYNLPLSTSQVYNFSDFSEKISLNNQVLNILADNGFVVIDYPFNSEQEYITQPYTTLKDKEIPIFITTDSLLHLYHIQFDETLRQVEEREFYDKIWQISEQLLNDSIEKYNNAEGDLKEALKRNVAYFSVGLSSLQPKQDQLCSSQYEWECTDAYFTEEELNNYSFQIPDFVAEEVEQELSLIEGHSGFTESPIFIYKEDYSQYVPRGHYTRSEKLKNYFKGFMWYGRISMLLKGGTDGALVSAYDAKIQTMSASIIASQFDNNEDLKSKWDRIYAVTAFYVGLSDDLGPYEYIEVLDYIFNQGFDLNNLTDENVGKIKAKLAEYRAPKIYGGTGDIALYPPFTPEQADEVLESTKGFRLMGQRFIPDSYMFQNLVFPCVGMYIGQDCNNTFTCELTDGGQIRAFPRGLDVMALLDSERAKELLIELGDTEYEGQDRDGNKITYNTEFNKLKEEFDSFSEADWQKNLYWSWLYALKPLMKEFGKGYPTFMQTKTWQDKELITALASWAELRHDTILYAKQSYTPGYTSVYIPPKAVVGYVEPVPEFYNRLLSLTRMTTSGLDSMQVLDETSKSRLENLERILERLVELSRKELSNQELTPDDYDFIKDFGSQLNYVITNVDEKAKKTTIIADVHTDGNTRQVLEEGVGYVKLMVVAYKVPDGRILIGAGPVFSYYEFKQPMSNRLTDEAWRDMLSSNPPNNPEWVSNFTE